MRLRQVAVVAVLLAILPCCGCGGVTASSSASLPTTAVSNAEFLDAIVGPQGSAAIEVFQVDTASGRLIPHPELAVNVGPNRAVDITSDAQGRFLYALQQGVCAGTPGVISSFGIATSGALTPTGQVQIDPRGCVTNLRVDPAGKTLYVSADVLMTTGKLGQFRIDQATGALTTITEIPTEWVAGPVVVHPARDFAYVALEHAHHYPGSGGFQLLTRAADGVLAPTAQAYGSGTEDLRNAAAFAGNGELLVSSGDTGAEVNAVDPASGALTLLTTAPGVFHDVAVDRAGRFAIFTVSTSSGGGEVRSYAVDPTTGSLTLINSQPAPADASHVVLDPGNKFVYVQETATPAIGGYSFDATTGNLAPLNGAPFPTTGIALQMTMVAK